MNDVTAWRAALAEWQRARALMDAFYDIGPMYRASEDWRLGRQDLVDTYGSIDNAKQDPAGAQEFERIWSHHKSWEDRQEEFYGPADEAARQLILTPAPDLDAILVKIDVTKKHELHFENEMGGEPWDIISAELRAIGGAA